jgi:hypothetical protein
MGKMPRYLLRGHLAVAATLTPLAFHLPRYSRSAPIIGLAVLVVVVVIAVALSRRSRRR